MFPIPQSRLVSDDTLRVRSLRNPEKKMSKSDPDARGCIYLTDGPDDVLEKCKKAVTDLEGRVTYDPEARPGVSNLVAIHAAITGQSPAEVCEEVAKCNTGKYKLVLAEVINEHLRPIRTQMDEHERDPEIVNAVLREGNATAREIAEKTMEEVDKAVGFVR